MIKHLLPQVPEYFKANLHTHSTVSDGKLTPKEARDAYKKLGYKVLALTDHSVTVAHQDLNEKDFLMLTGVELDLEEKGDNPVNVRNRCIHMCLIGKDPYRQWIPFTDPRPIPSSVPYEAENEIGDIARSYDPDTINKTIAECNRQGFLVTYNHPVWSNESYPEYSPLKGLWGMEYRNSGCIACGLDENNGHIYRDFLMLGERLMPVCADDTHAPIENGYPVLGDSFNMIGAKELTYESVIEAMEKGDLYASCGPEIKELTFNGTDVHIKCSPAAKIQLLTNTRTARFSFAEEGKTITEATFGTGSFIKSWEGRSEAYIRLIVTDPSGRYAVTRAYFLDELLD